MNSTSEASPASVTSPRTVATPGYRSVLIAEDCFKALRNIQVSTTDPRLDLKDLMTAAVMLAQSQPGFSDLVVAKARELLKSRL